MRELKVRAWTIKSNCWHYATLATLAMGCFDRDGDGFINYEHWCEYTGLKDKNGKEIYEGDIITPAGLPPTDFSIKLVEFKSGWYGYKTIVGEWNILADTAHEGRMSVWEVIGNIYENPELVALDKGEEKI